MATRRFSLKQWIGLTVLVLGAASVALLVLTSRLYERLAYDSQRAALAELIDVKVADRLSYLEKLMEEFGAFVQRDDRMRKGLSERNSATLAEALNSQHHQYYTTAGVLRLEKLYVFDTQFASLAQSTEAHAGTDQLCTGLLDGAQERTGANRLKIIAGWCAEGAQPLYGMIVPMGGLRHVAYLMVVTDPIVTLQPMEAALASPVQLAQPDGAVLYRSSSYPSAESLADFLTAEVAVSDARGKHVLTAIAARDLSSFRSRLGDTQTVSLVIAVAVIAPAFVLTLLLLRRAFGALTELRQAAARLGRGEYAQVRDTSFPDIDVVMGAFNGMADEITGLIKRLEDENIAREKVQVELAEQQRELEIARDRAMSASRTKSDFLARMSHEMRTPLTAIIGFADAALHHDQDGAERESALQTIHSSGKHLLQIINDILDLSKIEADKMEVEATAVNVFKLMAEVESFVRVQAEEKGLDFRVDYQYPLPTTVATDPLRLKQIAINLCGNAIKFTEKGRVHVLARYERASNTLAIEVADSGIGLTPDQTERVFDAFTQADTSTTRRFGGTGLGLSISKHLAQKLGGDITVQSLYGVGSRFTATVTAGEEAAQTLVESAPGTAQSAGAADDRVVVPQLQGRVLLVEDNENNQRLLSLYIQRMGPGIDLALAANGQEALDQALDQRFDLILMDMQMPVVDGLEATRRLRASGYTGPIVALTANAMKEDQIRCAAAGCNGFLTKPVDRPTFYATVGRHLAPAVSLEPARSQPSTPAAGPERADDTGDPLLPHLEDGDEEIMRIVARFIHELPRQLAVIRAAQVEGNVGEVARQLHQIKGLGTSMGYPRVSELARQIEDAQRICDSQEVDRLLDELDQIARRMRVSA